jgi:nucleoside-diphosphate-sugar epimerase
VRGISYCCDNEKSKNETFNITAGNARKINDLIDILKNEFKNIKINYKEREKFMPERGTLRTDKAKRLLNFKANHSIESGYQEYINWYKNFWDGMSK